MRDSMQRMRNRTYYYAGKENKKSHKIRIMVLLAALGALLWFWFFFKIQEVEVTGSTHYSEEQIEKIALRGPLAENSVLAPLLCSREHTEEISFIDAMEVSYVKPGSVLISVKEKQAIGCVRYLDCFVYFDREGTAIESSVDQDKKVLYFAGMEPESMCLDQPLFEKKESFLSTAVSLSQMIQKNVQKPESIQLDEKSKIILSYGDIQVNLGKDQSLDDKIERMAVILPLLEGRQGTLHLENVTSERKTITFEKK